LDLCSDLYSCSDSDSVSSSSSGNGRQTQALEFDDEFGYDGEEAYGTEDDEGRYDFSESNDEPETPPAHNANEYDYFEDNSPNEHEDDYAEYVEYVIWSNGLTESEYELLSDGPVPLEDGDFSADEWWDDDPEDGFWGEGQMVEEDRGRDGDGGGDEYGDESEEGEWERWWQNF
jgi:hypothetical protein